MIPIADSSVLIDYLRGRPEARALLRPAIDQDGRVLASALSRIEVLTGVRPDERPALERLFSLLDWVPVTAEIADLAGRYAGRYRRSHSGIDAVDYVIAATAETMRADLWSHNLRHFPMFPDLRAPY